MWGSFSRQDFKTVPELAECKKFMTLAEKKLTRKRKHNGRKFDELKRMVVDQLQTFGEPAVLEKNDVVETRVEYFKQNNPYIVATYVSEKSKSEQSIIRETLRLDSGRSDAYDITVSRNGNGLLTYDID